MSVGNLLHMTAPLRDAFDIPFHAIGAASEPLRLALVGGLHGNELNGIFVLGRLADFLAEVAAGARLPLRLHGRVVIIPAVNVLGVNTGSRVWPFDGTDINRMFPGYDVGETTQRIAHAVLQATRPSYFRIDVHSSNPEFEEVPQVRLYDPTHAERETARHFRPPAIVEAPTSGGAPAAWRASVSGPATRARPSPSTASDFSPRWWASSRAPASSPAARSPMRTTRRTISAHGRRSRWSRRRRASS